MVSLSWIVLGTLLVVVLIQLVHRAAGAVAAILWCVGLFAYGLWALEQGAEIRFLHIPVRPWTFAAFVLAMLSYNVWVLVRALRSR